MTQCAQNHSEQEKRVTTWDTLGFAAAVAFGWFWLVQWKVWQLHKRGVRRGEWVEGDGGWGEPVAIGWTRRCRQRWFLKVEHKLSEIDITKIACNT